MRDLSTRFLIGAALLMAGFGVLTDGAPLRLLDFKERQCRTASVAVGSACPAGCVQRPASSPADRARPTECHSRLWIATCGDACRTASGVVRLKDGALADASRLVVTLSGMPDAAYEAALADLRATLEPRFDGMFRYEASFAAVRDAAELEETKKRLAALPMTVSVEPLLR